MKYRIFENSKKGYVVIDEHGLRHTPNEDDATLMTNEVAMAYLVRNHGQFWAARASLIQERVGRVN